MSFESKMKNRGNKNLNKYANNPYHVSWFNKVPLWGKIVAPASLMIVVTATVLAVALPLNNKEKGSSAITNSQSVQPDNQTNSYENNLPQPSSITNSSEAIVPWEERTINDQYRMLLYNNVNYYSYLYPSIEEQYIGELLVEDITLSSSEPTFDNGGYSAIAHETKASLYRINYFDPGFVLAVKFDDDTGYYWYKNISDQNKYQTMADFINKIDLNQAASFPYAYYDYLDGDKRVRCEYENIDKSQVINNVFSSPGAYFCKEVELPGGVTKYYSQYTNYISVPIYIPMLHLTTSSNGASGFSFYDNGFMELTFMNKKDIFYIGEDSYQALKDHILNECSMVKTIN